MFAFYCHVEIIIIIVKKKQLKQQRLPEPGPEILNLFTIFVIVFNKSSF